MLGIIVPCWEGYSDNCLPLPIGPVYGIFAYMKTIDLSQMLVNTPVPNSPKDPMG